MADNDTSPKDKLTTPKPAKVLDLSAAEAKDNEDSSQTDFTVIQTANNLNTTLAQHDDQETEQHTGTTEEIENTLKQGLSNVDYCLNGMALLLPSRTLLAMAALGFQSILNTLPIAVFEILLQEAIMGEHVNPTNLEKILPVLVVMAVFTPFEAIQTYLHTTWRAINNVEPDINPQGERSLTWALLLLVPSLFSSFVAGVLTAKAGFSDPAMRAFMAFVFGFANMLKTLLGSTIPQWRILALIKELAPLNIQPILEYFFQPTALKILLTLYENLAPTIMGGIYGNFARSEVLRNAPEQAVLADILGLLTFEAAAAVTKKFDVQQVVESCTAFAIALEEATQKLLAEQANQQAAIVEEGGYVLQQDAADTSASCTTTLVTSIQAGGSYIAQNAQAGGSYIAHNAQAAGQATLAKIHEYCLSPATTDQIFFIGRTLTQGIIDFLTGELGIKALRKAGVSEESITKTMITLYAAAVYCIVQQAFNEYIINKDGTATLGNYYFGAENTASASGNMATITLIIGAAVLLGGIQAISKAPFMLSTLKKENATITIPHEVSVPIALSSQVITTGNPLRSQNSIHDLTAVNDMKEETKLDNV